MNEGNKGPFILLLSVIFIFLFLAALYQSWLLPFSVLPVIPVALAGALTALFIGNINNNIYTQIGLILLFGMACKTSILVVDFAKQRHQSGVSALEAACYAQKLRFRAVLMTALAFTLGTLPLAISSGPGSAGECSIGIPVVGGMVGTLIGGVLLSPIFYVVISKRRPKINSAARMNLILLAGLMLLSGCYTPPLGGALVTAKSIAEAKTKTPPQPENMTLLTRADAIRLALENNTDYRSAGLAINSAKMRYFQALGAYSPSLTAGGGVGQQIYGGENHTSKENNQNFFGNAQNSTTFYTYGGVQANVLIFNGLAREFEVVAAQHKVKQSDFLNENARRILIQSVLLAYDEVLSAQNQCKIAQSDRNFIQEELNQAKIKLRVGNLPELDVLSLTGQLQQAEINVAKAENSERIARFALTLLLGYVDCAWLEQVPLLADWQSDFANEKINTVDYYLNCALTNRPDLNALRSSLDAQRVLFYQRYSSFSPEIIGSANYTYSNADSLNSGGIGNFLINGNSFNYGGFAFWNIFDGFTRYNKLREGRLELDQAYLKGSAQWLQIVNEVRSAHSDTLYALRWSSLAAAQRDTMLQERNMLSREYHVGNAPLIRFQ
ncbi:MAG: efflux RND transporter permease subunit, partial [Victivallaceae bacterium]